MSEKPAWMKNLKKKKLKKTAGPAGAGPSRNMALAGVKGGVGKLKKTSGPKGDGMSEYAKQQFRHEQAAKAEGKSFTEALDEKSLEYFNEVCARPFGEQAQFFLNAFWDEFQDHAEAVYSIHWAIVKKVDMDAKGIHYLHEYEEGFDLDFDIGLVLFEAIHLHFTNKSPADAETYPKAVPVMMTSIKRKKELRDKVDVNFDGRVGFLEYLLYQFQASPKTLMQRSTRSAESNPELDAAKKALAEVNARIKAYEAEKFRLQKIASKGKGVKALGATNMLAQIESGPLAEQLRAALITAEAKVRIVAKKTKTKANLRASGGGDGEDAQVGRTDGSVWWLQRELAEKKKLYGARGHAGGKKRS